MNEISKYPNAYYRVSVKAIIANEDSEILLVKEHNNYWVLPGGGIDHGETTNEALTREISEEIGDIEIIDTQTASIKTFYTKTHQAWFMWLMFFVRVSGITKSILSEKAQYVKISSLKNSAYESERNLYETLMELGVGRDSKNG